MCRNDQEHDAAISLYQWCAIGFLACVAMAIAAQAWKRVEQIRLGHDCVEVARGKGWIK